MDTTEELNGTYFYRGYANLTNGELLSIIFLEEFCNESGVDSVSAAAILSGQPWLSTKGKPKGATLGYQCCFKICEDDPERCTFAFWYKGSHACRCQNAEIE